MYLLCYIIFNIKFIELKIFVWAVCRVEALARAKSLANGAGPGTFSILPEDALKNRT